MTLKELFVRPSSPIREAMARIDASGKGIALIIGADDALVGVLTDGDLRRAILHGLTLDDTVGVLLERLRRVGVSPVTAPVGTPDSELLTLMTKYDLRHIPLVDADNRIRDIALLSDLVRHWEPPAQAVIMAGGYGTRLLPLTKDVPKPMLPVGDRPILERLIEQLGRAGIHRVNVATHFKAETIANHFGDGREFNVRIEYVNEREPMGTAGALSLISQSHEPLLVINGDIVTDLDFRSLVDFHRDNRADMTVAVHPYQMHVPYGVVDINGVQIVGVSEKPLVKAFVLAGIYLLNPSVCGLVPPGRAYDMTDLISRLLTDGGRVVSFPLREYWLDVGAIDDYERAVFDHLKRS